MAKWNQNDQPQLQPVERGRLLAPAYDTPLTTFEIKPHEWSHLCSARFGAPRPTGIRPRVLWTGDSVRYDLFIRTSVRGDEVALRWRNGSGQGWLIAEDNSRSGEDCLLLLIARLESEPQRWDACHFLWQVAHRTAAAAALAESDRLKRAFVEGRLKKRRRRGIVTVEVL
jgi:hypothetical protein